EVRDEEVGERGSVARTPPARVEADVRVRVLPRLEAAALAGDALVESQAEQALPEAPRALQVVSRELDQRAHAARLTGSTDQAAARDDERGGQQRARRDSLAAPEDGGGEDDGPQRAGRAQRRDDAHPAVVEGRQERVVAEPEAQPGWDKRGQC